MLRRKLSQPISRRSARGGFTLIEVLIAMVLTGVVSTVLYTFFITSFNQYFALQNDGMVFGDLATQSQRLAMVLRSTTDITQATNTEITAYAYFSPDDTYVSQIHYYVSTNGKQLLADVTPMTANPPNGTLQTSLIRHYTIIDNFYTVSGVNTFSYLGTGTAALTTPIADLHTIKQIAISLASPTKAPSANGYDQISVQVMLRNRKTNL
jgi:prepilin-type N-terminal cleavage/methylation domain-containing protein